MAGLVARRLMRQTRKIVMENTVERNSSWADPLAVGAGQQVDRQEMREGARLVDGFETALMSEDEGLPPAALLMVASNGVAYPAV